MMDLWNSEVMNLEQSSNPKFQYSNIPERGDNA